jgi:hypothetical protein
MLRTLLLLVAFLFAAPASSFAQDEERKPLPAQLTFGYEGEGKVDASTATCEAVVKETVEWGPEETKKAIKDVCVARKRHVDAYAAIQKSYKALAKEIEPDHRIDPASAVTAFPRHGQALHRPQVEPHDRRTQHYDRHHPQRHRDRVPEDRQERAR